ncbi:putative modified peptide [Pseudoxanthomonas sp. GM95]|uniref:NHLP-related RiPP peptide n=1 Tax=Pseudoxanthomonas sp. GM95 TaxID=1881043 RepID=UPI0008D507EA|nr:NHLP-related RiPP peptide [Pseudoxanthomonas sp. GM95]SEL93547.1 putative modified peptide [Pseudoxanthomonas sp. GM95]
MTADTPKLTQEQAIELLDLLSSDDGFREQFATDPAAALLALGVDCGGTPPPCGCVDVLASKEELAAAREQFLRYFAAPIHMQGTVVFESGTVQAALAQY